MVSTKPSVQSLKIYYNLDKHSYADIFILVSVCSSFVVQVVLTNHVGAGFGWMQLNSLCEADKKRWNALADVQSQNGIDYRLTEIELFIHFV